MFLNTTILNISSNFIPNKTVKCDDREHKSQLTIKSSL